MGNNCIGYFIERFQCVGEIVDLPNFNWFWITVSRSGNQEHDSRGRVERDQAIGRFGICLSKDQTSHQTSHQASHQASHQTNDSSTYLLRGLLTPRYFYHQRDRPFRNL
ncbi:MAG: hypothetical protein SNJ81_01760 [Cyanobacteriota bacterium]